MFEIDDYTPPRRRRRYLSQAAKGMIAAIWIICILLILLTALYQTAHVYNLVSTQREIKANPHRAYEILSQLDRYDQRSILHEPETLVASGFTMFAILSFFIVGIGVILSFVVKHIMQERY